MTEESERIQKIADLDERQAAQVRLSITETILVLRYPRCKAAFTDFDGCFALTCHRNDRRAGFCAWRLQDSGRMLLPIW